MPSAITNQILQHCSAAHALAEQAYREHPAARAHPDWLEKRKYLLADLSLHMVQAALAGETADRALIRRYLYSILTVCHDFLPDSDLTQTAEKLLEIK